MKKSNHYHKLQLQTSLYKLQLQYRKCIDFKKVLV